MPSQDQDTSPVDQPQPEATSEEEPPAASEPSEEELLDGHGPSGWRESEHGQLVEQSLADGDEVYLIVAAADIRKSTFLMKEAINDLTFAKTISAFVGAAKEMAHKHQGWFDKFTGDGFLAYWPWKGADNLPDVLGHVWRFSIPMMRFFEQRVVQELRSNAQNFPKGIGLSMGLDAGPCRMAAIGGDVTIVGPPVVGAVRMVDASAPGEMLANIFLGELLQRRPDHRPTGAEVTREYRDTKEYTQEVYPIDFQATP